MNSYERVLAALECRPIDCLAFMPITMMFAADQFGVTYGEYVKDYRLLVESQLLTASRFDIDYVSCISDPAREVTDCGGAVIFFENQPPAVDESNAFLLDKSRLKSMRFPDPYKNGSRMRDRILAAELFTKKIKGERFIEGWVEGPCAEAADLRGISNLMTDFFDDPDFVRELFVFTTGLALLFAKAQIDAGCEIIGVGDAAASLVGPAIYKSFVFPFEKQLIDGIHSAGGRVRLHICGNIKRSLTEIGKLDADMVDIDSMVPIEKARNEMGEYQVLAGNIDTVKVVRNGTPELIKSMLADCLNQVSKNYIVGAGCEIPRDTPVENLLAMRDFAKNNRYK
ncbi:MAG: uroporphyrinogen decarboxylase family protein [Planctomycetaceae bacterium]|jgi:MtaA/CmuA family methyltransferase|nr:uroporphyrinogen decarboxylase family protein [Planctomycetaceae bacterium]